MYRKIPSLEEAFSTVTDFRNPQGRRYKLRTILVFSCLAIAHGAQSEEEVANWGKTEGRKWLQILGMKRRHGPSPATIQRIFRGIDRQQLNTAMNKWSKSFFAASDRRKGSTGGPAQDFFAVLQDAEGKDNPRQDSFCRLSQWIERIIDESPRQKMENGNDISQSIFDEIAVNSEIEDSSFQFSTFQFSTADSKTQEVSEAGLKIWSVDYESFDRQQEAI